MIAATWNDSFVLAIYPTARGFGWVILAGPRKAIDHGLCTSKGKGKNEACLSRIRKLFSKRRFEAVVLEAYNADPDLRSQRVQVLCDAIVALAGERNAEVAIFSRAQVAETFGEAGEQTRDEIAQAVARELPMLELRLPEKRGPGDSEDKRRAIFIAGALGLTYYQNGATALLDEKRNAA